LRSRAKACLSLSVDQQLWYVCTEASPYEEAVTSLASACFLQKHGRLMGLSEASDWHHGMHCNKTDYCVISRSHLMLHGNSDLCQAQGFKLKLLQLFIA